MTAPHDTQRRGRRWTIWACPDCGLQSPSGTYCANHEPPKPRVVPVEVAPVQSEGEREVTDEDVERAANALCDHYFVAGQSRELVRNMAQIILAALSSEVPPSPPTTQEARTDG